MQCQTVGPTSTYFEKNFYFKNITLQNVDYYYRTFVQLRKYIQKIQILLYLRKPQAKPMNDPSWDSIAYFIHLMQ